MKRRLVTLAFLGLAIVCYGLGAAGPGTAFLVLGGIAELIFWFRLFGGNRKS
jgi:hypothetical protein